MSAVRWVKCDPCKGTGIDPHAVADDAEDAEAAEAEIECPECGGDGEVEGDDEDCAVAP